MNRSKTMASQVRKVSHVIFDMDGLLLGKDMCKPKVQLWNNRVITVFYKNLLSTTSPEGHGLLMLISHSLRFQFIVQI